MESYNIIKYNVGCGKRNFGPDWVHVDGADYPHINHKDIYLTWVERRTIDLIYSSHMVAYFTPYDLMTLLLSWEIKLKPGGTLRIATPDFNILSKMYQVGIELDKLIGPLYGYMLMNNKEIFHKMCYDEQTLTTLLTDAGFINIHRYDHTKTEHPNTGSRDDFFDDHSASYINNTLISLNLECSKP